MNAFISGETSDDNHICIRCKQTINGLHNYVEHRKTGDCELMTANKFFNCLQLQYKYKYNEEEEEEVHSVNSDQSYQNGSEDNSDDEEEEVDIYRPPKNFTGGKWKPGSHPQSNSRSNGVMPSYISDSSSNGFDVFNTNNKRRISDQSIERTDENDWIPNQSESYVESNHSNNCQEISETLFDEKNSPKSDCNELKCKLCSFVAKNSFDLLKHYLSSSNHSSSDVITSESITKNETNLIRSLSFICEVCSFYTNQSNNYFWHLTTSDHNRNTVSGTTHFECKVCESSHNDVQNLMNHLENNQSIHTNSSGPLIVCKLRKIKQNFGTSLKCLDNRFKCDFCLKIFNFKTHLKKHTISEHIRRVAFPDLIKTNFIGDNPKYSCLKCDFKTDKQSTHLLHSVNHEMPVHSSPKLNDGKVSSTKAIKRSEDKYKCPLCDNQYICRELRKHINIHLNETPFECIKCDKKFSKLVYLKSHEKSHSGIKDKVCDICGTGFALNKLLTNHMKIHDSNRKRTVACDVCGAMFHTKYILLDHMKRHLPKSERQFKCEFEGCRYSFVTKSELSEHSRVHSGPEEKQLLCDRCPYKTKSIYTLRKHYRQHTGDKHFECQFCDFKTYLSSNLCRHIRTHSGEKPYSCPYCSYVCNTQENIRKHILKTKKHNGLYVYPCTHCQFKTNTFSDYRKHIEEIHSDLYSTQQIDGLVSHLFKTK